MQARAAVEPDGPAYREVAERFGAGVVFADGRLDRARLASLVFADPAARRDLEAIVHPAVRAGVARRVAELASGGGGDAVVVVEIPLLAESPASRAGIAAQASRDERLALAGFVVDNSGSADDLAGEVDGCGKWLDGLRAGPPRGGG